GALPIPPPGSPGGGSTSAPTPPRATRTPATDGPMPRRARLDGAGRRPPVRTCIGCRSRAEQSDLLRLVADGLLVLPDPHRRAPGRGAYLHPDPECWRAAERIGRPHV